MGFNPLESDNTFTAAAILVWVATWMCHEMRNDHGKCNLAPPNDERVLRSINNKYLNI